MGLVTALAGLILKSLAHSNKVSTSKIHIGNAGARNVGNSDASVGNAHIGNVSNSNFSVKNVNIGRAGKALAQVGLIGIVALVGIGAQFFSAQAKHIDYFRSLVDTPILTLFRGRIVSEPTERTSFTTQCSFLLATESAEVQKVIFNVNLRVRASISTSCRFDYGDTIWLRGSLSAAFNSADDFGIEAPATKIGPAKTGASDGTKVEFEG
jgi:hypothetical protein